MIGGNVQVEILGSLDIIDILFGELQDRDTREINLLLARQGQQHIERPFIAVEINHQTALVIFPQAVPVRLVFIVTLKRHRFLLNHGRSPSR